MACISGRERDSHHFINIEIENEIVNIYDYYK